MKQNLNRIICLTAAFAVMLLTTGCPNKLAKLKGKAEEAERELTGIQREKLALQDKIKLVADWERSVPKPSNAIQIQMQEIQREQAFIDVLQGKMTPKLDEINKEVKELSETELLEVLAGLTNTFPLLKALLESKVAAVVSAKDALIQGTVEKLGSLTNLVGQQVSLLSVIDTLPPGPPLDNALNQLAMLQAHMTEISFEPEITLAGWMAEQFEYVGPLPVAAGSFFPRCTMVIEEGLPSTLSHLNDGILATGSEVVLTLPPGWVQTLPMTVSVSNLVVQLEGNVPGANSVKIKVLNKLSPAITNDTIIAMLHGVQVGPQAGLTRSCMFVNPGRVSSVEFCVMSVPPPTLHPPTRTPDGMKVSWEGEGLLQQADRSVGPYTNRLNQANPQVVPTDNPELFLRIFRPW